MNELVIKIKENKKLVALLRNLILYGLIGGGAAVLDYGMFTLVNIITGDNLHEISSLCGQALGFVFSFTLNTFINFKKTDKLFARFLSYLAIVIIGMVISTLIIHLFDDVMNVYILKFISLVVVSVIQFILNKTITYNK